MFMKCYTSYCLVTLKDLWDAYVYVCMYVNKKSRARINKKISISLHVKEPFFLSDVHETLIFLTCLKNIQVPNFLKFRPRVQTDRQI